MKLLRVSIDTKNVVMTFAATVLFACLSCVLFVAAMPSESGIFLSTYIVTGYVSSGTSLVSFTLLTKLFVFYIRCYCFY